MTDLYTHCKLHRLGLLWQLSSSGLLPMAADEETMDHIAEYTYPATSIL